jgi:hypothetical protein
MIHKSIVFIAFVTSSILTPICFVHTFSIPFENRIAQHHWSNTIHQQKRRLISSSSLNGLDFDAIENDQDCELFTPLVYENDIIDLLISHTDGVAMFEDEEDEQLSTKDLNMINDRLKRKTFQIASCREDLPQPNSEVSPEELVELCMTYLQYNDLACENSGLEVCYNFSSDRCRAANGGNLDQFIRYANNPTFQSMVGALDWKILSVGTEIPGTPTRGAMKTILVDVAPYKGKLSRRFLWTMQKERRPPRQNCWLVHECKYIVHK